MPLFPQCLRCNRSHSWNIDRYEDFMKILIYHPISIVYLKVIGIGDNIVGSQKILEIIHIGILD